MTDTTDVPRAPTTRLRGSVTNAANQPDLLGNLGPVPDELDVADLPVTGELPAGLRSAGESAASAPGGPGDPIDSLPLVVADEAGAYQVVAHLIRPWDASVLRTVTLQVTVR